MPDVNGIMNSVSTITIIAVGGGILITVIVLFFVFRVMRGVSGMNQKTAQLLTTGTPAQAKVLALNSSGMMVNYNPVVDIMLEVHPREIAPYQTQVRTMIPSIKLAQVQPGMTVEVRYNPNNPAEVAVALR